MRARDRGTDRQFGQRQAAQYPGLEPWKREEPRRAGGHRPELGRDPAPDVELRGYREDGQEAREGLTKDRAFAAGDPGLLLGFYRDERPDRAEKPGPGRRMRDPFRPVAEGVARFALHPGLSPD